MKMKRIMALLLAGILMLGLAGCGGNGGNGTASENGTAAQEGTSGTDGNEEVPDEPVKIATKPMTEQFILGEMLKKLIEERAGYEVELTKGIGGGTSNIQPAMESGEFDLYPEYTSSGWILVLGHEAGEVSDEEMFE